MKAKIMLFAMMLAGLLVANPAFAQVQGKSPLMDKRVALFQKQLEQQGFTVTHWEDAFGPINLACLVCNGYEDIAYGNNAGAPYQVISETYEGVRIGRGIQLEPYDAVIFVGKTPPPPLRTSALPVLFLIVTAERENPGSRSSRVSEIP